MSIQASKVIGLPVVAIKNGEQIETVDDVLYAPDTRTVQALLVRPKGLFNDAEIILAKHIQSIGEDAVIVQSEEAIQSAADVSQEMEDIATSGTYLTQTQVLSEAGTELGVVTDIYFDVPSGKVEAFEVSQGGLSNVASGKKHIDVDDIVTVGKDKLIVSAHVEEKIQQQAQEGGVRGAVRSASQDARARAGALGGAVSSAYQDVRNDPKTHQFINQVKEKTHELKQEAGKVASEVRSKAKQKIDDTQPVTTEDGTIEEMPKSELKDKH